ncbi:MAG: hypothetical protein OK441_00720 [Thaumarchaeota archaeon]|nr:hypothetical protein [Nitrososphaerota archaeon]
MKASVGIVAAATVAFAALALLIHAGAPVGCPGCGRAADSVLVSGSIAAPSAYGVSELSIAVNDTATDPIWTIQVTNSSGLPGSTFVAFYHNTVIVSAANALTVHQVATGSTSVRNVTAGASYTLDMEFVFSTGATQNETLNVTAGG